MLNNALENEILIRENKDLNTVLIKEKYNAKNQKDFNKKKIIKIKKDPEKKSKDLYPINNDLEIYRKKQNEKRNKELEEQKGKQKKENRKYRNFIIYASIGAIIFFVLYYLLQYFMTQYIAKHSPTEKEEPFIENEPLS